MSLAQLSAWCANAFGAHSVSADKAPRKYDVPWLVLDSSDAGRIWGWAPATRMEKILEEIAEHAAAHPDWLDISNAS